jgi:diguanylate cyclase (GGDEF)-like protein
MGVQSSADARHLADEALARERDRELERELEVASHRDPLTGLPTRAWFDGQLAQAFGSEHRAPLTVMIADIDALQAVNEAHGHGAGDKVIFSVAACLRGRLRPRDLVARHTGAGFGVLLPGAGAEAARAVAERLRAGVAEARHEVALAHALHVTISTGSITVERHAFASRQELLDAAARALARAKRSGGDRATILVDSTGEGLDSPPSGV